MSLPHRLTSLWSGTTLATRFALAGGFVLLTAALATGTFVTARIERSVVRNAAATTVLYLDSFLAPFGEDLARPGEQSAAARGALTEILTQSAVGLRVMSYKIWQADGLVLAASDPALVGRRFPVSDELAQAAAGQVAAGFDNVGDEEDEGERRMGVPLLEIYSPIRADWSGDIVAVAELYIADPALHADLRAARRSAWIGIGSGGLLLGLLLYGIVRRGSATIEAQRRRLDAQLADLGALSAHNAALRRRVQAAAGGATAATEQALHRISADLHDGPAQLLAFAALRLDSLAPALDGEVGEVRDAIAQAMEEVRAISRGLVLPDIAGRPPAEVAALAIEAHCARTGETVAQDLDPAARGPLSAAQRICLYRFVQEGLNNASRHAGGAGLRVRLAQRGETLRVSVRDAGPGAPGQLVEGMGLTGLRHRIESLGGRFGLLPAAPGIELWMEIGGEG
ncbi:histidine kinase [Frigidibacter sp. MR17.14]|uniref:sensor histidine kinase n=1 Tax=Frigidibacter sp. MR17.14 TaxID=3126509 RepID=UPI00301303A4